MANIEKLQKFICHLDEYMIRNGKKEIDEMEANRELEHAGMLEDDCARPGRPLRKLLSELRDADILPQHIRQIYGAWKIRISSTMARCQTICPPEGA